MTAPLIEVELRGRQLDQGDTPRLTPKADLALYEPGQDVPDGMSVFRFAGSDYLWMAPTEQLTFTDGDEPTAGVAVAAGPVSIAARRLINAYLRSESRYVNEDHPLTVRQAWDAISALDAQLAQAAPEPAAQAVWAPGSRVVRVVPPIAGTVVDPARTKTVVGAGRTAVRFDNGTGFALVPTSELRGEA